MKNAEFRSLNSKDRRERILNIACNLFAEKGYDAVTTLELSQAAGCSETMLLSIFPTKADIYNALFEEWKNIVKKPPTLYIINDSPLDTLEKFFIDFITKKYSRDPSMRPNLERALYSRSSDGAKEKIYKVVAEAPDFVPHAIKPLIVAGQQKGEICDEDPDQLASLTWAIIQGCYYSIKDFPDRYSVKDIPLNLLREILRKK